MKYLKTFLFISFSIISLKAEVINFESIENRANLVELFTSESCSSCPPAENWMNQLKSSNHLWKSVVPVEFHVDYWNYLHWIDRFSKPEYTKRQRDYNDILGAGVYTPQFVLNGKDWRSWRSGSESYILPGPKVGKIKGKFNKTSGQLNFEFSSKTNQAVCLMAGQVNNQKTKVKSGENVGRSLTHEFATIDYQRKPAKIENGKIKCQFKIRDSAKINNIAVWIAKTRNQGLIQATGFALNP